MPGSSVRTRLLQTSSTSLGRWKSSSVGGRTAIAGLVVLGGLQSWWLAPLIGNRHPLPLFLGTAGLTAFTDNAALMYLGSQIPNVSEAFKYALARNRNAPRQFKPRGVTQRPTLAGQKNKKPARLPAGQGESDSAEFLAWNAFRALLPAQLATQGAADGQKSGAKQC